jgi:hypothetical protein
MQAVMQMLCPFRSRHSWTVRGDGEIPSGRAALSAFQAAPRKTIIAESSIHAIKPIAAASPPNTKPYIIFRT